jgi:asparagine N-glycosylation enzyme membrane subunit Stt3
LAFEYRERVRDLKPLFFLIVSFMLLLMAFKSRRFIEYWPPFAVLFAAFTIAPKLERVNLAWLASTRDRVAASITAAVVTVAGILWMGGCLWHAREDVKSETDPFAYRGASEWIAANTPPDSMIFNTDWDDFPMLFYYNPNRRYIVGLDPTYLYDRDPELWKLYANITLGDDTDPAPKIRERFGAEYVFTDNEHSELLRIAEDSGDFEKVYEDRFTTVLRMRKLHE